jgi:hypothetical protein
MEGSNSHQGLPPSENWLFLLEKCLAIPTTDDVMLTYPTCRFLNRIVSDLGSFSCSSMARFLQGATQANSTLLTKPSPIALKRLAIASAGDVSFMDISWERDQACAV